MVQVEEARSLQCESRRVPHPSPLDRSPIADAFKFSPALLLARLLSGRSYIPSNIFSSYTFNPRHVPSRANSEELDEDDHGHALTPPPPPDVALEINLSHLIECLNIFGGAGSAGAVDGREGKRRSTGGGIGEEFDDEDDGDGGRPSRRAGGKAGENVKATRVTAGRISWLGEGEPLEVLLYVLPSVSLVSTLSQTRKA